LHPAPSSFLNDFDKAAHLHPLCLKGLFVHYQPDNVEYNHNQFDTLTSDLTFKMAFDRGGRGGGGRGGGGFRGGGDRGGRGGARGGARGGKSRLSLYYHYVSP
jgi:hypothetical protein